MNKPEMRTVEVLTEEAQAAYDREALGLLDKVIPILAKAKADPNVVLRLTTMLGWILVQHTENITEGGLVDTLLDCEADEVLNEAIDALITRHEYIVNKAEEAEE
jgi:ferredoxin-fold anticodon binding domain-containing protein